MAVVRNPIPVNFSPDTTTRVLFQVPCIVEGIDVKQKFDAIDAAFASTDVTSRGTVSNITNNISNVSSSISASIGDLTNTIINLAATIPTPGGPTNAIQYKTGTNSISGSANFVYNPLTKNLTVGNEVVVGNNLQIATGQYNTSGNSTSLFVIGNGSGTSDRFDAFKVENHGAKKTSAVFGGGLQLPVRTLIYNSGFPYTVYTLTKSDYYLRLVNNDGAPQTMISLPAVGDVPVGTTYCIKNSYASGGQAEITFSSSQVDSLSSPLTLNINQSIMLVLIEINTSIIPNFAYWETFANT